MDTSTTPKPQESPRIIYSCTKGLFFIRIVRSFLPDGQVETVMYIPRWKCEAESIAERSVYWLNITQDFSKPSDRPTELEMKRALDRANRKSQSRPVTVYNLSKS